MPTSRVIGISLACLVTSACAAAKSAENNTSRHSAASACITARKAEISTGGFPCSPRGEIYSSVYGEAACKRPEQRGLGLPVDLCRVASGRSCSWVRTTGNTQFGKAAWYDLVGRETASGEILDTVTATAANRSLPLGSFAEVTDLDNGRSVIVRINDRGPYTRGRVIDLSPRAADLLHMKAAGVAAVLIEPMESQADLAVVASQTADLEGAP